MGFLESFLNLVLPVSATLVVVVLWPLLAVLKAGQAMLSAVFHENMRGKVVLITGASSGIGEHIAYEYARKGARLALVARREQLLNDVADRAMTYGASDAKVIVADVSTEDECKRLVEETITKYGRLDHLVNNAGVAHSFFFTDTKDIKALTTTLDTSFWSYVYTTYYALPHLQRTRGKILVIASAASWLPYPREILYNSAKAGTLAFFDTLRVEVADTIGITVVMPGWVQSEITEGKFVHQDGEVWTDQTERDIHVGPAPIVSVQECAENAVKGVVRGKRYVIVPWYYSIFLLFRVFAPEILEWAFRFIFVRNPRKPLSKSILEATQVQKVLYPTSVQKTD
jgi:short-subunit dehydrogenase